MTLQSPPKSFQHSNRKYKGYLIISGGILGLVLAPIMVIVKYLTGWAVVPEPAWIAAAKPLWNFLLSFDTPVGLWLVYGSVYTVALALMLLSLLLLWPQIKAHRKIAVQISYWVLFLGLLTVTIGDAVHTQTWHQNGLTIPTPGTNPVANTGYAANMMGMNFVLIGSLIFGILALRKRILTPLVAWLFILITPSAPLLTLTILPTVPSGGLWLFSILMIAIGYKYLQNRLVFAATSSTKTNTTLLI